MYSQQTHKIYNLKEPDVNAGVFPTTLEHCSYKCELCPRSASHKLCYSGEVVKSGQVISVLFFLIS